MPMTNPALTLTGASAWFDLLASTGMQQLHPYWRMEYIEAPRAPGHARTFRDLPKLGNDREALIVHRSRHSYLVLNRFPYNPGHLLAVPFRDVVEIGDLRPAERSDLMEIILHGQKMLQAALEPDGFNIGFNLGSAAGGSIAHLHAHIVPRWQGDNNFMPVLGKTRILPQALDATWERLTSVAARKRRPRRRRSG